MLLLLFQSLSFKPFSQRVSVSTVKLDNGKMVRCQGLYSIIHRTASTQGSNDIGDELLGDQIVP